MKHTLTLREMDPAANHHSGAVKLTTFVRDVVGGLTPDISGKERKAGVGLEVWVNRQDWEALGRPVELEVEL